MIFEELQDDFSFYSFADKHSLIAQVEAVDALYFIVSTPGDYSLMINAAQKINASECVESGWRCLFLQGEFPFSAVGIASEVTRCLADVEVSVLVFSGYKTDYFFVQSQQLNDALTALKQNGHEIVRAIVPAIPPA